MKSVNRLCFFAARLLLVRAKSSDFRWTLQRTMFCYCLPLLSGKSGNEDDNKQPCDAIQQQLYSFRCICVLFSIYQAKRENLVD